MLMMCSHQADAILCAKQVEALQSDLVARLMLLEATVHAKTAVPTAQVFVSVSTEGCVTSFTPPRQKKLLIYIS